MDINPGEDKHRYFIPKITVAALLTISSLLAALSSFSPLSVFGVLFTAAAAGFTAFVCGSVGSQYPLAAGAAAYVFALLFFGQPVQAVTGCAFLPCALVMNEARRRRLNRSKTMIAISAALGAGCVFYIFLALVLNWGGLSVTSLNAAYDSFMTGIRESFALIGFSNDIIETLIGYVLVLSPSMVVCLLLFTAYLTTAFYIMLCRLFRLEEKLLPSFPWQFEMSFVSACVFIAAYAVSLLFSSGKTTAISLTAENIIIILTPGFALIGLNRATNRIKSRNSGFSTAIFGVIALTLFFYNIAAFFVSVSFLGVIGTMSDNIKIRLKK
ncbi:MAG: DUF2232 domain-containing protein [Eubacteriales bacterium]